MLRITGRMFDNNDFYNEEFRALVDETLRLASLAGETRRLLGSIKKNAENLRPLFLTEEEQADNCNAAKFFDDKMKNMLYATFGNLEKYQLSGWKELIDRGEDL